MTAKPQEPTASPMLAAIRACITAGRAKVAALQELYDLYHGRPTAIRHLTIEEITVMCLRDKAELEGNAVWRMTLRDAAGIVEGKKHE